MKKYFTTTNSIISAREAEHMKVVRELAGECLVVLENDGVLPLGDSVDRNIALFGNGARHTIKGGTGSGDVNTREIINIEQGLEQAGFHITTKSWLDEYERILTGEKAEYSANLEQFINKNGAGAGVLYYLGNPFKAPSIHAITNETMEQSNSQLAIYVLSRNSGEGKDRQNSKGDYLLFDEEIEAIKTLAAYYDKFVLLLNVGGIIDTTEILNIEGINAIVLIGQPGNSTGLIVADMLLGKSIPSGKLTDTWAAQYSDYPSADTFSYINGNVDDEFYKEGIYVGYRYFDTFNIKPNYCFGYGKSYTDFNIETLDITADEENVILRVKVANTGSEYSGKEVVQIYYSAPTGTLDKPYQELACFSKTKLLAPGEAETLALTFTVHSMSSFSEKEAKWVLEAGEYVIRVGNHSRNTKIEAVIVMPETVTTVKLKNLFRTISVEDIASFHVDMYRYETEILEQERAKVITLNPSKIRCEEMDYLVDRPTLHNNKADSFITMDDVQNGRATIEELIAQLTVSEMAELCVGISRGGATVVGGDAGAVPGAGGQTLSLVQRKIESIILADGPAGLRLQPHFRTTKDGELLPGGEMLGDRINPMPRLKPEGAIDYYQYCTAIPIATTIAQSWDLSLIETLGALVGKEMQQFNVHLWLAPGMNIHRNPLCGRNFEYYSEDPLLTGKCAAATTKGVQQFKGRGTTIKHFAANNQEDNRMFTNAHVSERALREIYLKGFEIAIKEAQPLAMMTSYNLLNGVHTANDYDLIQLCARNEWGFQGLIVTDWYTSINVLGDIKKKYPISSSVLCIKAGNDLQMPGSQKNVDDIIEAINSNEDSTTQNSEITLADLQFNVQNILNVLLKIT